MARVNLFQLAKQNEAALRERYDAMLASHELPDRVQELFDSCEPEWTVSINCWAFQLLFLLEQGQPYNKYRYVHHREGNVFLSPDQQQKNETPVDWDEFWKVLNREANDAKFAPLRRAFNNWADKEEQFSYSAYFVGGEGAMDFGEFSMIMKPEIVRGMQEISFLIKDSLKDYLLESPTGSGQWMVNGNRIEREAATAMTVSHLMCIKMNAYLEANGLDRCKNMVCTWDDYLEGQLVDDFTIEAMEVVRVAKPDAVKQRRLTDLAVQGRLLLGDDQLTLDEQRTRDFHKSVANLSLRNVKIVYL